MATRYTIVKGPSKWDLMLSLFDSTHDYPRPIYFDLRAERLGNMGLTVPVLISLVRREDNSGESWLFEGSFAPIHGGGQKIHGWFKTTDRQGWLETEEDF